MKSIRESIRDFNHAWADLLRVLANDLNRTADRFDARAWYDEGLEIMEAYKDPPTCVCLADDLFCEVHNA